MFTIDRFEGKYAVCIDDDGNVININRRKINGNVSVGDVLREENGKLVCDEAKTQSIKDEIIRLQDELFE